MLKKLIRDGVGDHKEKFDAICKHIRENVVVRSEAEACARGAAQDSSKSPAGEARAEQCHKEVEVKDKVHVHEMCSSSTDPGSDDGMPV
jgi:hypothetical protein